MAKGSLSHLAVPGTELAVRVQPGARKTELTETPEGLRARVTAPPEDGRANDAVRRLLAAELGIAPGRVVLLRGQKSRDKTFRIED